MLEPMAGMSLILLDDDAERIHGALTMATSYAAMGERTRVFFHAPAVPLLVPPHRAPGDVDRHSAGLPTLENLLQDLIVLEAELCACQSGLAQHQLDAEDLLAGVQVMGPIAFLTNLGDDRLVMV